MAAGLIAVGVPGLDDVAATGTLTRAYTTMVAAGLIGAAAGSAAAGMLGATGDARPVLLLAAAALAAVACWTLARTRTLGLRPR